jgi:hypothetical protein
MEAQIERSKVVVRWIVAALLFGSVAYLKQRGEIDIAWPQIVLLTALLALLNFIYGGILRHGTAPGWLKYVTTATDVALISALAGLTGATHSLFYFAYFIVLISNSFRYGMGMALYVAVIYNVGYATVVILAPPGGDLTVEALKILAFWGIALYAGYLATRFQRQARILQSYEETILRLRHEVAELRRPVSG